MSEDTNTMPAAEVPPPEVDEETEAPVEATPAPEVSTPTPTPVSPLTRSEVEDFMSRVPVYVPNMIIQRDIESAIYALEADDLTPKEQAEQLAPLQMRILSSVEVFLLDIHLRFGGDVSDAPEVFRNASYDATGRAKESEFNVQVKSYFTLKSNGLIFNIDTLLPADVKEALQLRSVGGNGHYENKQDIRATELGNSIEVLRSNEPLIQPRR